MKLKEIYLASNNCHKKVEMAAIFNNLQLILPSERALHFECKETGKTFCENALLKAQALYKLCRQPVLADDSGLCVAALDGKPGIFSARFGSELPNPPKNDNERNTYLLSLLKPGQRHEACFVCALVILFDEYRFYLVQETVNGFIIDSPRGNNGFGYDPIFYLPELDKTMAELPLAIKNKYSHRSRAASKIKYLLENSI